MSRTPSPWIVTAVPVETILDLRHLVLRPGQPLEHARWDGDLDPETVHLAAWYDREVIGCATLLRRSSPDLPVRTVQLRGMAVHPRHQGSGVGRAVLQEASRHAPLGSLWCNARAAAAPFYTRIGWRVVSDSFDVPGIGPHHRMVSHP